jgi:hypothetical protein
MRWRVLGSLGLAAAAVALPSMAAAEQVRAGAEFRANTFTTSVQRLPEVQVKAAGDFIVAWTGYGPQDGQYYGVFAQRYDEAGTPLGAEFGVNSYTTSFQFRPRIASDRKGNFVVVWSSFGQDGSYYGVFGQRYDASGARRGAEFQVNSYTTGYQGSAYYHITTDHSVAMSPSGRFVVVWGSYDPGQDGSLSSVHGQRFDAGGNRLGGEFQVNSYTTGFQVGPSVAMADDDSFVVTWTTPDGGSYGISGQRYDASGARVGGEFRVSSNTVTDEIASTVRMKGSGEFTVTWSDRIPRPSPSPPLPGDVYARRFDAGGNPIGAPFLVNSYTTGAFSQFNYSFAMDGGGNFIVNWNEHADGGIVGIGGRRFRADGTPREVDFVVNAFTSGVQSEASVSSDDVGNVVSAWMDPTREAPGIDNVYVQRFGGLRPTALSVDAAGNRVWEPGETVPVAPTWRNFNGLAQTFGGALSALTGPAGATYAIPDGTASYGTVANGAAAECTDCYTVQVTSPPSRPILHWDATAAETITPDTQGQQKQWRLHIGASFADVSTSSAFYRFIETLLHGGVTGGCNATDYCPFSATARDQMAVFVLVAKEGPGYAPSACTTPVFNDVPASSPFCRFIEELARRGVVAGCGGGNYCPADSVTRDQMSVFVLRTLDPALNPPACTTPMFPDVPATSPFCRWIEELARRGVVTGCGGGNYCPGDPVTREQMGVFISVTFGLTLYGV